MKIIVGTRGSQLALTQTQMVIDDLSRHFPDMVFEIKVIVTKGDRIQHVSIEKIGDKGAFVKEIEEALLKGEVDLAVHSLKDMPTETTKGLMFAKSPLREDASDTLVTKHTINSIMELPENAVIATGSKRRSYQLSQMRPDIQVIGIRGNVDTRIRKMLEQDMDGVILATAGLNRLKLTEKEGYHCIKIPVDSFVPSPAQGILGIQIRENHTDLLERINQMSDMVTNIQLKAERSFLKALGGSCHLPIGAYCQVDQDRITLTGLYGLEDGSVLFKKSMNGKQEEAEDIGITLANILKAEVEAYGR